MEANEGLANSADIHGVPAVCEIRPLCCPAASSAHHFSLSPPALLSRLLENGGFDSSLYVLTFILQSEVDKTYTHTAHTKLINGRASTDDPSV